MNSDEIERFLRARVRDFDGYPTILIYWSVTRTPPTNRAVIGLLSKSKMDAENFSIRLGGATENAGAENATRSKMQGWKMQEWKMHEWKMRE